MVHQCLQAVASDSTAETKLIMLGLAETDMLARAEADSEGSANNYLHHGSDAAPMSAVQNEGIETETADQQTEQPQCSDVSSPGLKQPAAYAAPKSVEHRSSRGRSPATFRWRVLRLDLLRHMVRLQTYLDINDGYDTLHPPFMSVSYLAHIFPRGSYRCSTLSAMRRAHVFLQVL